MKKVATEETRDAALRPLSARPQNAAKVEDLAETIEEEVNEESSTIRLLLLGEYNFQRLMHTSLSAVIVGLFLWA